VRTDLRADVGGRLQGMREKLGLSQEALAERAGLHRNYVGSVERGERDIGLQTLADLLRALNTSLADFFAPFQGVGRPKR
jgi:transcriptional regulator with XRE-family HTH domain